FHQGVTCGTRPARRGSLPCGRMVRDDGTRRLPTKGRLPLMPASLNTEDFSDLIDANARYAESFGMAGFDGIAKAGVAIVTCMDSRIDPLGLLGLEPGDAKIFRNPGGRVTPSALEAIVLGVHLLNVDRVLIIPHTKCAMGKMSEEELRKAVGDSAGQDASWQGFHVVADQIDAL